MAEISRASLQRLLDVVLFIENTTTRIHGQETEQDIYNTLKAEFRKAGKYQSSILLLTPDRLRLQIAYTTISDTRIRAAEKIANRLIGSYSFRIRPTPLLKSVLKEGATVHVPAHSFTLELLPERLGKVLSPVLKLKDENSILTPLYRGSELIGIFGMTATELADLFTPSVKSFAMHIGRALELAAENKKRQQAETLLGESEKHLWVSEHSLREFSRKILKAREEEAKKISADLHDETGSMAVALGSHLEIADQEIAEGNSEKAVKSIRQTKAVLQSHIEGLRRLAARLRPLNLEYVGLPGALRLLFAEIKKQSCLRISFRVTGTERTLDESAAIALYRIAQEAMNNTLRHAKAKTVSVRLRFAPSEVDLSLRDDGCGFDANKINDPAVCMRVGLRGMKERAQLMDGIFQIDSHPGEGCSVRVRLPLDAMHAPTNRKTVRSNREHTSDHRR